MRIWLKKEGHVNSKSSFRFVLIALTLILFFPAHLLAVGAKSNRNPGAIDIINKKIDSDNKNSAEVRNKYQPYLTIGGAKYFNQSSDVAGIYDLFIPLLQNDDNVFFTDLRIFDRSGSSFEGNAHIGYRTLLSNSNQMFGVYGSFDRKKTNHKSFFNQLAIGLEYWNNNLFVGGNFYQPIGATKKYFRESITSDEQTGRGVYTTKDYEKALTGFDAELGYSFTNSLTGYAGAYYFKNKGIATVAGPKARITYDYNKPYGRALGILDGVSLEAGIQHDKPRGKTAYIGVKLKIGLTDVEKNSNIFGFEKHMVDPVRRDPDIVVGGGKEQAAYHFTVDLNQELRESLEKFGVDPDLAQNKKELPKALKLQWRKYVLRYHPDKSKDYNGRFLYYVELKNKIDDLLKRQGFGENADASGSGKTWGSRKAYANADDVSQFSKSQLVPLETTLVGVNTIITDKIRAGAGFRWDNKVYSGGGLAVEGGASSTTR